MRMAAEVALAVGDEPAAMALELVARELQEACADHGRRLEAGNDITPVAGSESR